MLLNIKIYIEQNIISELDNVLGHVLYANIPKAMFLELVSKVKI